MRNEVEKSAGFSARPVTEENIRLLVDSFYGKIRQDPVLAPVFSKSIGTDWQPHLSKMYDFWSSVMLTSGRYKGNPVAVHKAVEGLEIDFFDRWLGLFNETCHELFDADTAEAFRIKANRIADSLELALFYRPDVRWERPPR
jgi:hemoglobin